MLHKHPSVSESAKKQTTSVEPSAFLQIENIVKDFGGVRAVNNISVNIAKGEIFALLGSSGCGKSTLLRMLAGFETPSSGRILLNGVDIAQIPPYKRPINMMFQSYALFPHLSVQQNIAFGLKRENLPAKEIKERVAQMLALVQLEKYAERKPHQLSGGQQQRVALVRSLAKRPQLLLLDEPLGALDKKLREQTQLELVQIIEQVGVTCVMVTHDQEESMTMASRIAVMSEGQIRQVGSPTEIYESPNCRFVADFIGHVNLFDVRVEEITPTTIVTKHSDMMIDVDASNQTVQANANITLALRPEKIYVGTQPPTEEDGPVNHIIGEVIEIAYLGSYTIYHIKLPSGLVMKATMINSERKNREKITWNDKVHVYWATDAMVILTR